MDTTFGGKNNLQHTAVTVTVELFQVKMFELTNANTLKSVVNC